MLFYIKCCADNVTVHKRIRRFSNQKAWMMSEVQKLLKSCNTPFTSGDNAQYRTARADLKRGIKEAKEAYKKIIEDHLTHNDPRRVWQGLQHITNYKGRTNSTASTDGALAEQLNRFFARFEVNTTTTTPHVPPPITDTPHPHSN